MKRSSIILLALFILGTVQGQDRSGFIGLKSGASIPVGKYHEKELPEGGFALTGVSMAIEGAWFFMPWLGIGGNASVNFHPVDAATLGREKMKENPFLVDLVIRSDEFMTYTGYAGLFIRKPIAERLELTAKALGGVMFARTPYQLYKAEYYQIGKNWYEKTPAGDYEGSFLAGAGLKYFLKSGIGFSLDGEFTYNQCDFDFITNDGQIRTDQTIVTFVNVTLGIVVKIK